MAFTEYQLKSLKPGKTRRVLTETGVSPDMRGLQLWVFPTGSKTFMLRYKMAGRTRYLGLGSWPETSLAAAHKAVQTYRGGSRNGIDPLEWQDAKAQANREAPTVRLLYEDFRDHYLRVKRKQPAHAEGILEHHILPDWENRKAASITRREIIERVREIEEAGTPRVAYVTGQLLGQMFSHAVNVGLLEYSPAVRLPAIGSRGEIRERVLSDEEIRQLWTRLEKAHMDPQCRVALKLLLVTGQRRQEIALAKWEHIDRKARTWRIPAENSKNGKEHVVPLSPLALSLLDELAAAGERKDKDGTVRQSAYLVPSRLVEDRPIHPLALTRAVRKNKDVFKIEPAFSPHTLRHTAATYMHALGIERLHVTKVLNHSDTGITARYDSHDYLDEKRAALNAWARHLTPILEGKKTKVTPLRRAS